MAMKRESVYWVKELTYIWAFPLKITASYVWKLHDSVWVSVKIKNSKNKTISLKVLKYVFQTWDKLQLIESETVIYGH